MWIKLADEIDEWVNYNFDSSEVDHPLLGVVEEIGELSHAILKNEQGIRGTSQELQEQARDAIGDITIYLVDYANRSGVSLADSIPVYDTEESDIIPEFLDMVIELGLLVTEHVEDGKKGPSLEYILRKLSSISSAYGWSYEDVVIETWEKVSGRDWVEFPETGFDEDE